MSSKKTVITTCTRDCPNACGLVATVEDGRLTGLAGNPDHPLTRGVACVKAARYVKRVYSPERVTHPMLRRGGRWVRAGWDEVLDLVADRLKTFASESGTESILYYQGYGERTALKLLNKYFFNLFGGVTTLRGSLCGGTGQASQNLDLGQRISHDPLDHYHSQAMILWARNPVSTNISLTAIARDIRGRGGSVLLIDPVRSKSAVLADHHIAPRPGGDVFLAMAAAKLVLAAGAEDREFLARHAVGVEAYLDILSGFSVDDLCRRAGVSRGEAELLAETLMARKPASILLGWGLHRHEYAHYGIRAIDALAAICGNLGVPGGGVSQGFEEYGPYDQRLWGDDLNPPRRTLLLPVIGREILAATDPPIRMIYVTAANPLCMAPNTAAVAEAFGKAEFVVYSGHTMDDTSDFAHVFLPATTFLEETDVMASYGHNYVGPVNPAIAPVGQCKSEFRMFYELAARFPFADRFRKSEEQWLRELCAPVWEQGGDPDTLTKEAFRLDAPMVPYADKVFPTPSGKFQFLTAFDPSHIPGPDPDYPYRLLTIAPHGYICSERTMADHEPLPVVRLAASEAARRGLEHGRPVMVKSPLGQAMATLRVEEGLRPDVLAADRGGWTKAGHGLNRLTRDLASRVGNGTPYYETAVTVCPVPKDGPAGRRILVVQHSDRAPGGDFVKGLARLGALPTTVAPARGDTLPASPEGFDALVVLGGPQHAYDDAASPHFPALLDLMRAFDAARRPVAGICLGAQLLARAHGGRTWPMGRLEFGFTALAATAAGMADPVLGSALPLPRLMEFHEDSFDLPPEAVPLITGQDCPSQCFRMGAASYGFQFHLEVDSVIVSDWIKLFRNGDMDTYAPYREVYGEAYFAELGADLPVLVAESQEFCRRVVRAWLALT